MNLLFVYGTLMKQNVQIDVIGRICEMKPACLSGYRICHGKWPYLVSQPDETVPGQLIANLSDGDMSRLDAYEETNIPHPLYRRAQKEIDLDGDSVSAWVYLPFLENWRPEWLQGGLNG